MKQGRMGHYCGFSFIVCLWEGACSGCFVRMSLPGTGNLRLGTKTGLRNVNLGPQ